MRQRRPAGVKILGVVFVLLSLYSLGVLTQTVIYHFGRRLPVTAVFWAVPGRTESVVASTGFVLEAIAILVILWTAFAYLATSIGTQRLRPWVRALIFLLAIDIVATLLWNHWILCSQMYSLIYGTLWLIIFVAAFVYLSRPDIKAHFGAGAKRFSLASRWLIGLSILFVLLKLVSIPLFIGSLIDYTEPHFSRVLSALNTKPVKAEYRVQNRDYLTAYCEKRNVLGHSAYLPKDLKPVHFELDEASSRWYLYLEGEGNDGRLMRFVLKSEGRIAHAAEKFGFEDPYEFEKVIRRPSWRTLDLCMKVAAHNFAYNEIEDVTSSHWRGFVRIRQEKPPMIRCTLYDLVSESSVAIEMVFERGSEASNHARDMLATLRFETAGKDALAYLAEGKKALTNGEYVDASFDFLNAYFLDQANPEHAYYFARSLFEDQDKTLRHERLRTITKYLKHTLELDSTYHQADELLATVEKEIESMKRR